MRIYVCSSNPGKLGEFALVAHQAGLADVALEALPELKRIQPPEETGSTFEENATAKALYYSGFTSEVVLADDSGLSVDALNGAPGVLSARYAGPNATDDENNNLLLRDLGTSAHREARFVCVLALAREGRVLRTYHGVVEGRILLEPRGTNGFGYDPLFFYPPFNCSFGELPPQKKFSVSHRGNAIRALVKELPQLGKA
ncbi:MAG TPA: RdgB/HAM1 family non-canonical purine NTP pyrophosphatase [Bryobacteraceae bacterium]|nr:RdgB/HAM1 family non-canonical purine NTP pyrophosphatase [Bryobacteraceae bacterium]